MLTLKKYCIKPCPGHRMYVPVYFFTKDSGYLTCPFRSNYNVFVTTNNDLIANEIKTIYNCQSHKHPFLIPRSISEFLSLDLVLIMNTYCDLKTREQEYDLYYVIPSHVSIQHCRALLIESEETI